MSENPRCSEVATFRAFVTAFIGNVRFQPVCQPGQTEADDVITHRHNSEDLKRLGQQLITHLISGIRQLRNIDDLTQGTVFDD